jgi:hypothetical protein
VINVGNLLLHLKSKYLWIENNSVKNVGDNFLPYADSEKQKAYCRNYQKEQRELLKKLKLASNLTQESRSNKNNNQIK